MEESIRLLRKLVREELGRNLKSPPDVDVMRDWRHLPGVHASVTVNPASGVWNVIIIDQERGDKLPMMTFKQESEAIHYARKTSFDIYNKRLQGSTGKKKEPSWS